MRRSIRYILLFAAGLLLAAVIALGWLFGTNEGARWLLHAISRSTSLTVAAKSVEGTLLQGLRIEELRVSWPEGRSDIREFTMRWRPAGLLLGRVSVSELSASNMHIWDNRPESAQPGPPELSWPKMTGILTHVSIGIGKLHLDGFVYRRRDGPPVIINRLEADLRLSHGTLTARKIIFVTPEVKAEGEVTAGFSRASFRADLSLIPRSSLSGLDRFRVNVLVLPAGSTEAGGGLKVTAMKGATTLAEFESRLRLTRQSIGLNAIRLFSPGHRGELKGEAELVFIAQTPAMNANLAFNNVDLSKKVPYLSDVSGNVKIQGTTREYHGTVSIMNKGTGWKSARLETVFKGTPNDITLTSLKGRWLEAAIDGSAHCAWKETIAAEVSLKVRGLNPAAIAPEWSGAVNADLTGAVRLPKKKPEGEISLRLLKSRVRGRALTGEVKARLKRGSPVLDRLAFRGMGFAVNADGNLASRINLGIRLSDLSLFRTDAKGRAVVQGWVRQRNNILSGFLNVYARDLFLNGAKASSVKVSAGLQNREGRPFSLNISVRDAAYNIVRADSATVNASGTTGQHTVKAGLQSPGYTIETKLTGSYADGIWQGKISGLSGTDPMGRWGLQSPASLKVSNNIFSLSPLVLTGRGEERLELGGTVMKNPLSGSVSVQWQQIAVSRANAWLSGITISGFTAGRITGKVLPDERLELTGNVALSRSTIRRRVQYGELKADFNKAELSLAWQGETLEGKASLVLAGYGHIDARVRAPVPARLPVSLNRAGPLQASVKGNLRESGTLSLLFPGLIQESRGEIEIDLRAAGTWNAPEIKGSLLLDKAAGYFPAAGIRITDIHADARIDQNRIRIDSLKAHSGRGNLEAKAVVTLEGWSVVQYEGSLQGDRFQALFLPQMRMLVSPKIEFKGDTGKLRARGEVRVPELLIYGPPKEAPVKPSEDVVIVGRREAAEETGQFSMDIEIKVILGDRIIVKAEGADAQLGGELLLTVRSIKRVIAKGEITVKKGKYSAYGLSLEISRGRIFFAGGPVENPTLDILALKTINAVKAGVTVTGTLSKPLVKLYSQPAMPDADILAYIVLGRPLGQDKEQSTYLMQAAGALLSAGQSVALQDQVKQRLGLDTIDIETGGGSVSRSLVTIGKYLSSKLYVSYGRALFTGENLFRLRYKMGKRWELESHSGQTSGVDLFYMIQFD